MYFLKSAIGLSETIIQRDDGLWIPLDKGNRDYQEYLAWVAEGNEAEEWV